MKSLRMWFLIHFVIDYLFGVPLMLFPTKFLSFMGFTVIDPFTARLVGAALISIGGISAFKHDKKRYTVLLNMKIIWSLAAMFGILITLAEGGPIIGWFVFAVFLVFNIVWVYYRKKI